MKPQRIGDIRIDRIVEREGPFAPVDFLLPEARREMFEDHFSWLIPRYMTDEFQIVLSFHGLILRSEHLTILVDCCVGSEKERPTQATWHRQKSPFLQNMISSGIRPEEIDVVLCTHLHADHVGWNTQLEDGRWVPTFPNARYIFAREEYAFWEKEHRAWKNGSGNGTSHVAGFEDSILPVVEAGRAVLVDSDHEIDTGLWLEPTPGHTPGNVALNILRGGQRAIIVGDTVHTPLQLCRPELSSRFCVDPELSFKTRLALIERVADTDTLFLTAHFPSPTAARIRSASDGSFRLDHYDD